MNSLWQGLVNIASRTILSANVTKTILSAPATLNTSFMSKRFLPTLLRMHQKNMEWLEFGPRKKKKRKALEGKPFAKGIVLKTLIKKPRKPNSANRKCVLVRLSTGKEMVAFVPGVGHNLQEHQTVLCRNGRLKDTPGVKIRCVRGAYDLPHVKAKKK